MGDVSPSGLSTQFYEAAPEDWANEQSWGAPATTQLTGFIYYSNDVGRLLRWPASQKGKSVPKPFFVRWTGTLSILQPGDYSFDLVLSSRSRSQLMINEDKIVTKGQCGAAKLKDDCTMDGCSWTSSDDACAPKSNAPVTVAKAQGVCIGIALEIADASQLVRLEYNGPDTNSMWATIPTTVLSCNPICPACANPREDACTKGAKDGAA